MKIAVTYEDGKIFPHFGRTENFKVYEVENGSIVSSEVIGSNGAGHGALAGVLAQKGIDTLICGGLGGGAMNALTQAGIKVVAGAEGDADEAVRAYLRGEIISTGVNCDHHDHEGEDHSCGGGSCASGEGSVPGDCSASSCSSCVGGCGGPHLVLKGKNAGRGVRVHYEGTFNDGTKFDSSYDRGEALEFLCGTGMMIRGFDQAVADMEPGQTVEIHLMPEEAYGMPDPENILTTEIASLPGIEEYKVGDRIMLSNAMGQRFPVTITSKTDTHITLDANHEMAGKELNFRIELLEVM